MNVRKLILNFFEENGVYIGEVAENDDIDLHEYIADSMQYVYFIVELEKNWVLNCQMRCCCMII